MQAGSLTVAGTISGTGKVIQSGSGATTLTAANTYTGPTKISAGVLAAGTIGALGANSAVTINSGATLDLAGQPLSIGSLSGSGAVSNTATTAASVIAGGDLTSTVFSGIIQDAAGQVSLTHVGTGSLTLTGSNTYTGPTTITAGSLQIGNGSTGSISASSAVSINSGGTLWLNTPNGASFANSVTNAGLVDFMQAGSLTVAGTISGTGSLIQSSKGFNIEIGRAHV